MLSPLIRRTGKNAEPRSKERGVTMALVAVTMAVLIARQPCPLTLVRFTKPKPRLSAQPMPQR